VTTIDAGNEPVVLASLLCLRRPEQFGSDDRRVALAAAPASGAIAMVQAAAKRAPGAARESFVWARSLW
jgi:hypothetical protein